MQKTAPDPGFPLFEGLFGVRGRLLALLVLGVSTLYGCSSTELDLETTNRPFPSPAVNRLPIQIAAYLPAEFTGFVHSEELEAGGTWTIAVGDINEQLFRTMLPAMFERVEFTQSLEPATSVDGYLVPAIEELQFSLPGRTTSEFTEVWIRYSIRLLDADAATEIATWKLIGYGKSERGGFIAEGGGTGVRDAAYWALRDAGAAFAIDFSGITEVRDWMAEINALRDNGSSGDTVIVRSREQDVTGSPTAGQLNQEASAP